MSDQDARELMERFLDGSTSIVEEKKLYAYFRRKNIAADMEQHRDMMNWYAAGMSEKMPKKYSAAWRGAGAAAVIVAATVSAGLLRHGDSAADMYAQYEGSYVMINGEKVTNLKEIMPYLHCTELLANHVFGTDAVSEDYFEHREMAATNIGDDFFSETTLADEMAKIFDEN